ncbi:MAG: hypothetical protein CL878_03365 [Dehalococcoidia bacterium]|nr:hypothetical protein [Dehalococcoidia bacterium]
MVGIKALLGPTTGRLSGRHPPDRFDLRSFGSDGTDYPYDEDSDSWDDLIGRAAPDFAPDVVVWWRLEHNPLPGSGPAECPLPLVGVVGDWNLTLSDLLGSLHLCDHIVTDRAGVSALQRCGLHNVSFSPWYTYEPEIHRLLPDTPRIYDITFAGNLNHDVQRERATWLRRLALLGRRYRVRIETGVFGDDYTRLLNQSKIVFNRSIKGELNQRAHEAAACGALVLLEDTNVEVHEVFAPGRECVLYNEDNFERVMEQWLSDDEGLRRVASAGHGRVQRKHPVHRERRLLELLADLLPDMRRTQGGHGTAWQAMSAPERSYRRARGLALGLQGAYLNGADRALVECLNHDQSEPEYWSALGALRVHMSDAVETETQLRDRLRREALRFLTRAVEHWPTYALAHYNLANLHLTLEQPDAAMLHLTRLLALLTAEGDAALPTIGYYYPREYDAFAVEWERVVALADAQPGQAAEGHGLLLAWDAWRHLADIFAEQGRDRQAFAAWDYAIEARPDFGVPYGARAKLHEQRGRPGQAADDYKAAIEREPFYFAAWHGLARTLRQLERTSELQAFIDECLTIIDACPNYEFLRPEFSSYGPAGASVIS